MPAWGLGAGLCSKGHLLSSRNFLDEQAQDGSSFTQTGLYFPHIKTVLIQVFVCVWLYSTTSFFFGPVGSDMCLAYTIQCCIFNLMSAFYAVQSEAI